MAHSFVVLGFETRMNAKNEPVDYVEIAPKGEGFNSLHVWWRVPEIIPKQTRDPNILESLSHQAMVARWELIGPQYEAWKNSEAIPENGTPLAAWGGVNQGTAGLLKQMGITTVEAVAEMSQEDAASLRVPNGRRLPELAKSFLGSVDVTKKDNEIADMKARMAEMEAMLAERVKPEVRRGRPPKDSEAA